jgi:hypothetical protein
VGGGYGSHRNSACHHGLDSATDKDCGGVPPA